MASRADAPSNDVRPLRRPLLIAVALVVMALSAGGVWAAWRIVGHGDGDGAVPLIRADDRPVKVPPRDPGGLAVPDENFYVLNGGHPDDAKVEQLLPPPEQPLPRPAPPEPTLTDTPNAPPAAAAPTSGTPSLPPALTRPSAETPASRPGMTNEGSLAAPATSDEPVHGATELKPAPHAETAKAKAVAPVRSGYRLQVGAMRSEAAARTEWARLKRAEADILGALGMRTVKTNLGARGVFYRIEAGPIADAAAAERACAALKQRKVGCILVRP